MASIIRMTAETVQALGRGFDEASTELDARINTLQSEVEEVAAGWEGDAYDAFVGKFDEIKTQLTNVSTMFDNVNSMLNEVVNAIQDVDDRLAAIIRGNA